MRDKLFQGRGFYARQFTAHDLPLLMKINNDETVRRVRHDRIDIEDKSAVLKKRHEELNSIIINQDKYGWSRYLLFSNDGELLGHAGFFEHQHNGRTIPEFGIQLLPSARGKGLGTEISKSCMRYLFNNTNASNCVATAMTTNPASNRMLEKLAMERQADKISLGGDDGYSYTMTREHYFSSAIKMLDALDLATFVISDDVRRIANSMEAKLKTKPPLASERKDKSQQTFAEKMASRTPGGSMEI